VYNKLASGENWLVARFAHYRHEHMWHYKHLTHFKINLSTIFFSIKNLVNFSKISSKLQILQIITTPVQHVVGTECPPCTLLDILSIRVSDIKHPPYYWLFTICPTRVFKCVLTPYQNQTFSRWPGPPKNKASFQEIHNNSDQEF